MRSSKHGRSFRHRRNFLSAAGMATLGGLVVPRAVHSFQSFEGGPPTTIPYTPFQASLPIPPTITPLTGSTIKGKANPPFVPGSAFHGIAPEFADIASYAKYPLQLFRLNIAPSVHEFIPGVKTPVWAYNGSVPGPTFKARQGQPFVVRVTNNINVETSVHLHGGHNPSHADGFPTFYTEIGKDRDYFYPNTVPKEGNVLDYSESVSTCWYHDHAMDLTGPNAYLGLAGFYLSYDDLETSLIGKVLPASAYDIPMIFCDKRFNSDGSLYYDMLDHNGALGDVFTVNGKVQPKMLVERRKYRFRLCNGSNARFYEFRLSDGSPFLQVGKDAWLLPFAMQRDSLMLAPGQRADIIIDFANAPKTLYFENILEQTDGRRPDGIAESPVPLIRFDVGTKAIKGDVSIAPGTALRPHIPILESEIVQTRTFELGRNNGVWIINNLLYDPDRIDARIKLGTAERWILKNGSGGWWHPIHIHLESHQVQSINGNPPPLWESFKSDVTILEDNESVEIFMKFRTFKGPFVFHCHNMEHEDMRMMMNFATV